MQVIMDFIQLPQLILLLLATIIPATLPSNNEERLIREILRRRGHRHKLSRPVVEEIGTIDVQFSVVLHQIVKVDEKNEFLFSKLWMTYEWNDIRMAWNESEYGDVHSIRLDAHDIWTPDILLYNSADEKIDSKFWTDVEVTSDGRCKWMPLGIFVSSCAINIRWFPFDEQRCRLKFGSWTYDGTQLNLWAGSNKTIESNIYQPSGEWDLVAMPVARNVYTYDCCGDLPYVDITYTIHVRRRALYYCFNLIIPCALISLLLLFAFRLPPESGQKITLSITILLSMSVLQMIVAEMVPATSLAVPLIGTYFACVMIVCSLSVIMSVLVLNLHHRSPDTCTVPPTVKTLICGWLARLLRMSRPGKSETAAAPPGVKKRRRLILGAALDGRQSRSLLANVLDESDLHLRYRSSSSTRPSTNAQRTPPVTSNIDGTVTDRKSSGAPSPDDVSPAVPELTSLLGELRYITRRMRSDEEREEVISDWKFAAMVIDRLCFYVFSAYLLMLSVVFFGLAVSR